MILQKYQDWCIQNKDNDVVKFYTELFKTLTSKQEIVEALAPRDTLHEAGTKVKTGAFFTPLHIVSKMYEYLDTALGVGWQSDYVVWDMCCGSGNLLAAHLNPRKVFLSTLEQTDVDILKASGLYNNVWQYDYLNDDVGSSGIDYSITNKVPSKLQQALKFNKKILILINPPYLHPKGGLANTTKTKIKQLMLANKLGKASNELAMQFMYRVQTEFPNAVVAILSPPKYLSSEVAQNLRDVWEYEAKAGFLCSSKHFEGVNGEFPLSFIIWGKI